MASASIPPNDDNDEFDWEAAVIEIDSACQVASTSTPNPQDPSVSIPRACPIPAKINDKVRQSTLERFVDSFTKRKKGNKGLLGSHVREKNVPLDPERDGDLGENDASPAVKIDLEAAKTWIYPVNVPLRDYQFSIARTALFSNTLVALPTGLGKTLIAAVVMYNYFRWFPEGKIVFAAPSRPLVMQQIEACHNIVGIPQEWAIDMTGQMSPLKRSSCWKSRRVFFVTPQVLEKDIQSGIFSVKELVCLVIDEAHRALGNYSYCVAVRELMAVPVQLRILALTATPGSKQRAIQNVIDNLCISTLEYRNEDDKDVSPHVHNRKLELIQVSLGKDAIAIDNLLLEVIRPYVARLFSIGVLYSRDCATLSPCELLISRDKFRQTPPLNLPHAKYGEVEGCFGALITLYHIKKLLSSHGIRPAYEMLQEKLTQGSFARLMTRNETMSKAKLLMQQSLSHGVPNPKLVKMLEVLVNHFKTNDPRDSRVIIFSNFRGSVKDIMDSLANIDNDLVKATEFIGQSSAKTLKGQSQKVQQAVLQRFRAGGFNVIVATSIGEEGLDIMEVDLVICFDANISPLRMIQRMGRTGRKHDGRVVVLACEGSELKGYLKKQATGKTVRKHMHNGGLKSFDFHASPRMIPHICKPEVQFVELSIEQFIPRGKKVKDNAQDRSPFPKRVSHEEHELIVRYFHSIKEDAWKPSLIAFPSFQAFPCDVHKVQHSFKTIALLIDAVQKLQRLSFSKIERPCLFQIETPNQFLDGVTADKPKQDSPSDNKVPEALLGVKSSEVEALSTENPESKVELYLPDDTTQNYPITVLPLKMSVIPKTTSESQKGSQGNPGNNATPYRATEVQNGMPTIELEQVVELASASKKCVDCEGNLAEHSAEYAKHDEQDNDKFVLETSVSKAIFMYSKDSEERSGKIISDSLGGGLRKTLRDTELSPRLTYYIEEGIVPESPMTKVSQFPYKVDNTEEGFVPESPMEKVSQSVVHMESSPCLDSAKLHKKDTQTDVALQLDISISSSKKNEALANISASLPMKNVSGKSGMHYMQDSVHETENKMGMLVLVSPDEKFHTPLADPRINSSSEDWRLSSGGASGSIQQAPKYRRLCKYGDQITRGFRKSLKDKCGQILENGHGNTNRTLLNPMEYDRGKKKARKCINTFIEEEAEVSEDAEVSADEEEDENENEYEDSFIDDRINPTEACSEAENAGDVMAFYRRSLLTQSPVETLPRCPDPSYDSVSSRRTESGSCSSENLFSSIQTPQHGLPSVDHSVDRNSLIRKLDSQGVSLMNKLGGPSDTHIQIEFSTKLESRKRKLSFQFPASIPSTDFQLPLQCPPENTETDNNLLGDDDFYQSLDLDAVEAQATELLRNRSGLSVEKMPQMILDQSMGLKEDCSVDCLGHMPAAASAYRAEI